MKQNALVNYVQASIEELRKVSWPTKNQAIRLTFLVLGFCVVTAFILGILDYVFNTGHQALLDLAPGEVYEDLIGQPASPVGSVTATDTTGQPITIVPSDAATGAETTETTTAVTDTPATETETTPNE